MRTKATVAHNGNRVAIVYVCVSVKLAEEFCFENSAMVGRHDLNVALNPKYPHVTYNAILAAHRSATFFARHELKAKAFAIDLVDFGMEGDVFNATPFAIATTVAIHRAIGGIRSFATNVLGEWNVVSVVECV